MKLRIYSDELRAKLEAFRIRITQQGKSRTTIDNAVGATRELLHWMEGQKLTDTALISQELLDSYFGYLEHRPNWRRGGGLSNEHLIKCFHGIKLFYAFDNDLQVSQVGLKTHYKPKKSNRTVLTRDEVQLMYETCEDDAYGMTDRAILACFYGLGLRLNELYSSNEADINFSAETFLVRNPKNGHEREVPMAPRVSGVMEEYLYQAKSLYSPYGDRDPALIIGVRGSRLGVMRLEVRMTELALRSGIRKHVTPHVLRHSIGTHLILQGLSVFDVMTFLGHRCLDSTQVYIHQAELIKREENGTV